MKKINYIFIFLFIILFTPHVFAYDYSVGSTITSPSGGGTAGTYSGTEIYETGMQNVYSIITR